MKKTLLIGIILLAGIYGCKKEDTRPDCEKNSTAVITLKSISSNPYAIYQNGTLIKIANPNSTSTIVVKAGAQEIEAVQQSGYIVYPTISTFLRQIESCKDLEFKFP